MAEKKLKLKLLVDSKTNKVVYAEAGKEFVDFLFHILSLPVGTVMQLLNANVMAGCIGSLHKSVQSLDSGYFLHDVNKDVVLKPKAVIVNVPLLKLDDVPTGNSTIYRCSNCYNYASPDLNITCPGCRSKTMSSQMTYVPSQNTVIARIAVGGYVKEMITYMVTDNLEVKPMSTITVMNQMNKLNVKDVWALTEKEVEIGFAEGLAILKASFEVANTALTSVFLIKKEK